MVKHFPSNIERHERGGRFLNRKNAPPESRYLYEKPAERTIIAAANNFMAGDSDQPGWVSHANHVCHLPPAEA
jgi:hypothetical protein